LGPVVLTQELYLANSLVVVCLSSTTHNATHNRSDLHVVGRTYAAVRNLQVVDRAG